MSIDTKRRAAEAAQADLQAAIERAERAATALRQAEQVRISEPPAGSRVLIEARFPKGNQDYTYLALRTENSRQGGANWYVTGQHGKVTWDRIISLVEHGTYTVKYMSFAQ